MEERGTPPATRDVAPVRARVLPWALANLGLYLLTMVVGAVVIGVLDAGRLGIGQGVYAAGILIPWLFPGWLVHLVILGLLPAEWSRSRARVISVLTSPIWLILPYVTEGLFVGPLHVVALAYALIARLRQPRQVSS